MDINVSEQPKILNELIAGLKQAAGGASQLIHQLDDPRWIMIREAIELTQEGVFQVASFATKLSIIKPS